MPDHCGEYRSSIHRYHAPKNGMNFMFWKHDNERNMSDLEGCIVSLYVPTSPAKKQHQLNKNAYTHPRCTHAHGVQCHKSTDVLPCTATHKVQLAHVHVHVHNHAAKGDSSLT